MITVNVNGQPHELEDGATIAELLQQLNAPQKGLAAEVNGQLVPATQFEDRSLNANEEILLVRMVGGG